MQTTVRQLHPNRIVQIETIQTIQYLHLFHLWLFNPKEEIILILFLWFQEIIGKTIQEIRIPDLEMLMMKIVKEITIRDLKELNALILMRKSILWLLLHSLLKTNCSLMAQNQTFNASLNFTHTLPCNWKVPKITTPKSYGRRLTEVNNSTIHKSLAKSHKLKHAFKMNTGNKFVRLSVQLSLKNSKKKLECHLTQWQNNNRMKFFVNLK